MALYIEEFDGYYFNKKQLFSKKGNKIKLTLLNYTKGYWMGKKFVSLNKLKSLHYYTKIEIPF